MKKIALLFAMVISIGSYAQITMDFEKPLTPLVPVKLSNTVVKFMNCNLDSLFIKGSFRLLNTDGSVYKEIFLPPNPSFSTRVAGLDYVTTSLFDTDSTSIEYLVTYDCDSLFAVTHWYYQHTLIANENGVPLLNEKYASLFTNSYQPIVQIGNQSKLVLWYSYGATINLFLRTRVFNLPGHLPNGMDESKALSTNGMSIYPNPNNGNFFILSKSFEYNVNTIDIYSINGKLIDTYKSTGNPVQVSNLNIGNGLYLISPRDKTMKGSRVVIQK